MTGYRSLQEMLWGIECYLGQDCVSSSVLLLPCKGTIVQSPVASVVAYRIACKNLQGLPELDAGDLWVLVECGQISVWKGKNDRAWYSTAVLPNVPVQRLSFTPQRCTSSWLWWAKGLL